MALRWYSSVNFCFCVRRIGSAGSAGRLFSFKCPFLLSWYFCKRRRFFQLFSTWLGYVNYVSLLTVRYNAQREWFFCYFFPRGWALVLIRSTSSALAYQNRRLALRSHVILSAVLEGKQIGCYGKHGCRVGSRKVSYATIYANSFFLSKQNDLYSLFKYA